MISRIALGTCAAGLAAVVAVAPVAQAVHGGAAGLKSTQSQDPRRPNYDIRTDETARATLDGFRQEAGLDAGRVAALRRSFQPAEAALRAKVPGLVVEYSEDLRQPEVIGTDPARRAFLTGPGRAAGQPHAEQLRAFLAEHAALVGLDAGQVGDLVVRADYTNPDGNLSYVDLGQELNGLPVFRGEARGAFTRDGRLVRVISNLAPHLEAAALPTSAGHARDAVAAAARHIGREAGEADLEVREQREHGTVVEFARGQFDGPTTAEQMYFPVEPGVARLAWRVLLWEPVAAFYVIVDAETGALLWRKNIANDQATSATYGVYASDSPAPLSPTNATPGSGIQGAIVSRSSVTLIGNEPPNTFNNLGWITDGGTTTDGNNVEAGVDRDGTNGVDATGKPVSAGRNFSYAYNPAPGNPAPGEEPNGAAYPPLSDYRSGVVTNLFYWTNRYHDALYNLGFTELARNFQNDNFGRGGVAADRVSAEAQDSAGTNNANFATPADGGRGRMQMFLFPSPTPDRDGSLDAEVFLHELTHGLSNRLIGNASGLTGNRAGSMGEGWSDFYARALLATAGESVGGVYAAGAYVTLGFSTLGTDNYYYGIRRFPYAVKTTTGGPLNRPHNPLTLADIDPAQINTGDGAYAISPWISNSATEVHNAGEVWCMALLEVRARLITRLGFATGNQRALQIVTDGMKISPLNPNFIQARDAVLAAAQAIDPADVGDVWAGFATRGMGYGAQDGLAASAVVESFSLPNLQQSPAFTVSDVAGNDNGWPEPGERLLLSVPLTNPLAATATGVTLSVNGGTPVNYGNIVSGATVTQVVGLRVPVAHPCGTPLALTFDVNSSLGPTTINGSLTIGVAQVASFGPFSNTAAITINDNAAASPYPSNVNVAGTSGPFDRVVVRLNGLTHTFPGDVDALLVGPGGQKFVVMSDAGGGGDVSGINLALEDAGAAILNTTQLASGTARPTNYDTATDAFPAPAPAAPYANPATAGSDTLVGTFGATTANGTWSLYVRDDAGSDSGSMSGGWSIEFSRTSYSCGWTKGDFDRDLATDLLFRRNTTGQNDVWLMNGTTRASLATLTDAPASLSWSIVGADDFNGDRENDLAFWNSATGQVEFWLMNGTSRVGAPVPISGAATLAPNWKLSATADFNADGKPDIVWRNFTSQKIVIWTMNGTAKTGNVIPTPDQAVDANWEIVGATDLNGDGATDFLWYNPSSGKIVYWWMNASVQRITGNFTNPANAGDANWRVQATGNFGTGAGGVSGSNDIVWRNATSGRVVVWNMDFAGNRTAGAFTTPDAPSPNPTEWTVVGPR